MGGGLACWEVVDERVSHGCCCWGLPINDEVPPRSVFSPKCGLRVPILPCYPLKLNSQSNPRALHAGTLDVQNCACPVGASPKGCCCCCCCCCLFEVDDPTGGTPSARMVRGTCGGYLRNPYGGSCRHMCLQPTYGRVAHPDVADIFSIKKYIFYGKYRGFSAGLQYQDCFARRHPQPHIC